jgi:hypothetical protein
MDRGTRKKLIVNLLPWVMLKLPICTSELECFCNRKGKSGPLWVLSYREGNMIMIMLVRPAM